MMAKPHRLREIRRAATRRRLHVLTRNRKAAPADSRGYVVDEQVGFRLRLAMQRHTSIFMSRMTDGLTQTQFAAMTKLKQMGPCSQNQLGRLISLDAATIKGVVDRLRVRGFVTTVADPGDKRRRAVRLSDDGQRAIDNAESIAAHITAETLSPLSPEERRTLLRLLERLS
jgi:MarR family transcriptional regulator, lower aerobic nicotinate degradation pathway regulator